MACFTDKFYQTFTEKVIQIIHKLFQKVKRSTSPLTLKPAITVLPKPKTTALENENPVSLLNIDTEQNTSNLNTTR